MVQEASREYFLIHIHCTALSKRIYGQKEEKGHDERIANANAKIKQAGA
jgi:hypothetical protein